MNSEKKKESIISSLLNSKNVSCHFNFWINTYLCIKLCIQAFPIIYLVSSQFFFQLIHLGLGNMSSFKKLFLSKFYLKNI